MVVPFTNCRPFFKRLTSYFSIPVTSTLIPKFSNREMASIAGIPVTFGIYDIFCYSIFRIRLESELLFEEKFSFTIHLLLELWCKSFEQSP